MPMKATPIVAIVVHDVPVITDTTAEIEHARNRNITGLSIFTP